MRIIDNTDISVSRYGFGTSRLHRVIGVRRQEFLLDCAISSGVTHFDIAPIYGAGVTLKTLAKISALHGESITVASKFGLYPSNVLEHGRFGMLCRDILRKSLGRSREYIVSGSVDLAEYWLDQTLRLLKRDYLDFYFLHEPQLPLHEYLEIEDWLCCMRKEGKIKAWGVAGEVSSIMPFIESGSALTQVVQTRVSGRPDCWEMLGLKRQFSYGYYDSKFADFEVSREHQLHHQDGCILFSASCPQHIKDTVNRIDGSA